MNVYKIDFEVQGVSGLDVHGQPVRESQFWAGDTIASALGIFMEAHPSAIPLHVNAVAYNVQGLNN
jgi:hypothetical protein